MTEQAEQFNFVVNGAPCAVTAAPDTPLLHILRNDLQLKGTRFGCGAGACGSCTVTIDGRAMQSCDTPVWSVQGCEVVTVEDVVNLVTFIVSSRATWLHGATIDLDGGEIPVL